MPTRQDPKVLARRLRIFAFVKEYMEVHHDSPSREEIMAGLDLPDSLIHVIGHDLRLLRRADGLPMELRPLYGVGRRTSHGHGGVVGVDTAFAMAESPYAGVRGLVSARYVET